MTVGTSRIFEYQPPANIDTYQPLLDKALAPKKRIPRSHEWATAYFRHRDPIEAETLIIRDSSYSPSSLKSITPAERAEFACEPPEDGSDMLTGMSCVVHGIGEELRTVAFYPALGAADEDGWRNVEFRVVWRDHFIWAMPWPKRLSRRSSLRRPGAPGRPPARSRSSVCVTRITS